MVSVTKERGIMNVDKPSDFKTMLALNETGKVKCIDGEFYIQKKHVHHVMDKYRQEVLEAVKRDIVPHGLIPVKDVHIAIDKAIKGGA